MQSCNPFRDMNLNRVALLYAMFKGFVLGFKIVPLGREVYVRGSDTK